MLISLLIHAGAPRVNPVITYSSFKEKLRGYILCSNQTIHMKCANDEMIRIINADYGRQHRFICGTGNNVECSSKRTTTAKMKELCENRTRCWAQAVQENFEDACPGENKYLHTVYKCVKKKENLYGGKLECWYRLMT